MKSKQVATPDPRPRTRHDLPWVIVAKHPQPQRGWGSIPFYPLAERLILFLAAVDNLPVDFLWTINDFAESFYEACIHAHGLPC
jgi:hypothetical protein